MSLIATVVTGARLVRVGVLTLGLALVPAYVALQEFDRHYGVARSVVVAQECAAVDCRAPAPSAAVRAAIAGQERAGSTCGTRPVLTDAVVVEGIDGTVRVVTIAEAVRTTADRSGRVRAYCTAP